MAQLREFAGSRPVNDGEQLVVKALVDRLPETYVVVPNVEVSDRHLECDAIVFAPHAVFVVEVKAWHGPISGDEREWIVRGRTRPAPTVLVREKAKKLKGCLQDLRPDLGSVWVQGTVVLAIPPQSLGLTPAGRADVFTVDQLISWVQDASKVPAWSVGHDGMAALVESALLPQLKGRDRALFRDWEVTETLESGDEFMLFRARHYAAPSQRSVRLRVAQLSRYRYTKKELDERSRRLAREFVAYRHMGPHANIVAAQDYFEDDFGNHVLVFEEVDGKTLRAQMASDEPWRDRDRRRILRDVASALTHVHEAGVIHRGVTPSNVVLTGSGAKLSGFGVARVPAAGTIWDRGAEDAVDIEYAAPELRDASIGELSQATDVFGLGCIAWSLWAGRPPFENGRLVPVDALPAVGGMPGPLEAAVRGALAATPSDRATTAASLLAVLDELERLDGAGSGIPKAPAQYDPGETIENQYEVERALGRGQSATVYQVHDTVRGEILALKLYNVGVDIGTARRELNALQSAHHRGIVKVIDLGQTRLTQPPQYFLKMEYVDGERLSAYTAATARLPVADACEAACQLLEALEAIHPDDEGGGGDGGGGGRFVHRDIKPDNILRCADGRVVLLDFNIASRAGGTVYTMSGTQSYQAPDPPSDVWDADADLFATGVVLFELIHGTHPYRDGIPALRRLQDAAALRKDVPDGVREVLNRAVAPNRADRYRSARQMRHALEAAFRLASATDEAAPSAVEPVRATGPPLSAAANLAVGAKAHTESPPSVPANAPQPVAAARPRDVARRSGSGNLRVYELARELGLTNKECLDLCESLGIGVKSPSSSVVENQADRVRRKAERQSLVRDEQPPEPAAAVEPIEAARLGDVGRRSGSGNLRVYELARELGLTNKECLGLCESLGIGVKSHSSSVVPPQADRVRRKAEREGLVRDEQPPESAVQNRGGNWPDWLEAVASVATTVPEIEATAPEAYVSRSISAVDQERLTLEQARGRTRVDIEDGQIIEGTVVAVSRREVLLDVGYKSEGIIPARELSIRNDVDPSEVVSLGDKVEALVLQKENKEGRLVLSKKRAQYERAWGTIQAIKEKDGDVSGPVIEVVKGGLIIDIGLRGFLPESLVEMHRVGDLQPYVGRSVEAKIIELDKTRNNVVLSRRALLEERQRKQRADLLANLKPGEDRRGIVRSVVKFGAFVDLGGTDGLVHISEMSRSRVDDPHSVVKVGDEVVVRVISVDQRSGRVSLSIKQARSPTP